MCMDVPFEVGDVVELEFIAINSHGEGIAKKDEFVIFVPGVKKGERCKVKIMEIKRTYAIGHKK